MKLFCSNGKILEIYEVGSLLMRISSIDLPIKENGYHLLDDDRARVKVSGLIDSDLYDVRSFRVE